MESNRYFGKTEKSIKTESFNISLTQHSAQSEISLHSHAKPYLCLLATGVYSEKSLKSSTILPGDVLFRPSQYEHANQFSDQGGLCLNIEFEDQQGFMDRNDCKLSSSEYQQRGSLEIYQLLFALKNKASSDLLNIRCYEAMTTSIQAENKGDLRWIEQVKSYIHDDPTSVISLKDLSTIFNLHPNYLVRKFKEVTGLKLSEYLTKVRLENSIRSLLSSNYSMTQIALDSGFFDQSHFNRHFRKQFGTTPGNFRKKING